MKKFIVPIVAILAITGVEMFAISKGIDGKGLTASVAAISAITGYYYHKHSADAPKA